MKNSLGQPTFRTVFVLRFYVSSNKTDWPVFPLLHDPSLHPLKLAITTDIPMLICDDCVSTLDIVSAYSEPLAYLLMPVLYTYNLPLLQYSVRNHILCMHAC